MARKKLNRTGYNISPGIRLKEEEALLAFMEGRINAPIVQRLLSLRDKGDAPDLPAKETSRLSADSMAHLHELCRSVQASLGLEGCGIDYHACSHPRMKAASFFKAACSEEDPHLIILNADLINTLSEAELSFVIGHEMGHLTFEHDHFKRISRFIYPDLKKMPYLLRNDYELWSQLAEMSADRVGLMAAKDIEPAVMALFKCARGSKRRYRKTAYMAFVTASENLLMELSATSFQPFHTHPADLFQIGRASCRERV